MVDVTSNFIERKIPFFLDSIARFKLTFQQVPLSAVTHELFLSKARLTQQTRGLPLNPSGFDVEAVFPQKHKHAS